MGRRERTGFDYFSVQVDLVNDPKLHFLLELAGVAAVGVWTLLLTDIYRNGGWAKWGKLEALMFARRFHLAEKDITKAVSDLAKAGFFSRELLTRGFLSSHGIQKRVRDLVSDCGRKSSGIPQHIEITHEEEIDLSDFAYLEEERKEDQRELKRNKGNPVLPLEIPLNPIKPDLIGLNGIKSQEITTPQHDAEESRNTLKDAEKPKTGDGEALAGAQVSLPKKRKVELLPENGKKLYGKFVWLSDVELEQLQVVHGPEFVQACIEKLDAYIESNQTPKTKKNGINGSATIRSWVITAVTKAQSEIEVAKRSKNGYKPHTAASTVEKNEEYIKENYGQELLDQMHSPSGVSKKGIDSKPDGRGSLALLPTGLVK